MIFFRYCSTDVFSLPVLLYSVYLSSSAPLILFDLYSILLSVFIYLALLTDLFTHTHTSTLIEAGVAILLSFIGLFYLLITNFVNLFAVHLFKT